MVLPVATALMKSLLAPKARHSHQSPPRDGFAVANLGQRPRVMKIKKTLALKARFTPAHQLDQRQLNRAFSACLDGAIEFLGRCPRLDFEIAPLALRAATGFLRSL
jgi:hypothetical protein